MQYHETCTRSKLRPVILTQNPLGRLDKLTRLTEAKNNFTLMKPASLLNLGAVIATDSTVYKTPKINNDIIKWAKIYKFL